MKQLLLLLSSFFLLNCSTENKQGETTTTTDTISEVEIEQVEELTSIPEPVPTDSSFESFLIEFCANEEFQLSRVEFPFEVKLVDIMDEEETRTIVKSEWQHSDLLDTAGIETQEYDKYSQVTEVADSVASIKLRGIDNGIRIDYTFLLKEGRWYLVEIFNSST